MSSRTLSPDASPLKALRRSSLGARGQNVDRANFWYLSKSSGLLWRFYRKATAGYVKFSTTRPNGVLFTATYTTSGAAKRICGVSADGHELWDVSATGGLPASAFEVLSFSGLVVYVYDGGYNGATCYVYSESNGAFVRSYATTGKAILAARGDKLLTYVAGASITVYCHDAATGSVLWSNVLSSSTSGMMGFGGIFKGDVYFSHILYNYEPDYSDMTRVTHYMMDGTLVSTHDYVWAYWTRLITGVNYCLSPIYYYGDCTIETCLDPWTASTYTKAQGKIDSADHVVQVSSSSPFVAWYALPAGNLTGSYAPEAAPLGTTGTWDSNGSEIVVAGQVATTWGNHKWSPFIKPYSLLPATVTRAIISALKPPRHVFIPTMSAKGTVTPPTVSMGG